MNLFQRVLSHIVPPAPPCGHERELVQLRNELIAARSARQIAESDVINRNREIVRLEDELEASRKRITALQLGKVDLAEALEEAMNAIAVLKAQLAEAGWTNHQLTILHAPGEGADENADPPAGDTRVGEAIVQRAYRMIGLFFEGRHFWWFARGEERIKASIHDKGFLERMARREVTFLAGDTMVAKLRVAKYRTPEGATYEAEHSVEEVLRIVQPDQQIEIPQEEVADVVAR